MFKKMFCLVSALTLLMSGTALAGDSNWEVYGLAHASINSLSDGADSRIGLTSNTSRFGFRGVRLINDDLSAIWQFESLINMAGTATDIKTSPVYEDSDEDGILREAGGGASVRQNGTTLATRDAFVGLRHVTLGSIKVGRFDTPFKVLGRTVEMFPDQLGDFRMFTQGLDNRLGELVAWKSPDWDGFGLYMAYMFDQAPAGSMVVNVGEDMFMRVASEPRTTVSGMASYTASDFLVGVAYETRSVGWGNATPLDIDQVRYADGRSAMRFVAKYMGDQFDLGALIQTINNPMWKDGVARDLNSRTMCAGATFHANEKWDVKGAFFLLDTFTDAEDDADTTLLDESDTKATMVAFGVDRIFNKYVTVYAQVATISNGDVTNIALGGDQSGFGGQVSGTPDSIDGTHMNPSGVSVGTIIRW